MELFTRLFGNLLVLVYHCFDRIVIHGYLSGLSRPEQVVHFVRQVHGIPVVSKEVLSQRTHDYQTWVEAFARHHQIPMEWAEKGLRKEDYVLPALRRLEKQNAYGVYFIFKSMEQGRTFRISMPKFPTKDPNHRILAHQRSRFTHYYFYIRDEVLGPDHCARGEFLSVSRHLLAERPLLHRTGTEAKADPFSEERQCLPGGRRCGRTAGGCRPAESMHHPQTTQLLDLDPGTQVLPKGTGTNEPVAFLRHRANRILPQFRFQTSFPDPQALRAKL